MPPDVIHQATSFLFSIRNPVDRIHSAYRYSHPANCRTDLKRPDGKPVMSPGDYPCLVLTLGKLNKTRSPHYRMWKECFPSPAMEDFAQAILPPWTTKPNTHFVASNFTKAKQMDCRQRARRLVQGLLKTGESPHMQYSYRHYANATFLRYPEKDIFVLRTEQKHHDMVQLDLALGGTGQFSDAHNITHGSELYQPSKLSEEAYHKLCCVLEEEIDLYFDIFNRALNLDQTDWDEANESMREKCGLTQGQTWLDWRTECREKLQLPMG